MSEYFGEKRFLRKKKGEYRETFVYRDGLLTCIMVSYDPTYREHGIVLQITEAALNKYWEVTKTTMHRFLKDLTEGPYRITLIDISLSVLFVHEDLDLKKMYEDWKDGELGLVCFSENQGMFFSDENKENGVKQTQLRFKVNFRGAYAVEVWNKLMDVDDEDAFVQLVAKIILYKAGFVCLKNGLISKEHRATQLLEDYIGQRNDVISPFFKKTDYLARTIQELLEKNELCPLLYIVYQIWGDEGFDAVIEQLFLKITSLPQKEDLQAWLEMNGDNYREKYPTARSYFTGRISILK